MNKLIACVLLLVFMVSDIHGQARTNTTDDAAGRQPKASSGFIEKLLEFFGISDSPSTLKAPGDEVASGELWLADLNSGSTRALTSSAVWASIGRSIPEHVVITSKSRPRSCRSPMSLRARATPFAARCTGKRTCSLFWTKGVHDPYG